MSHTDSAVVELLAEVAFIAGDSGMIEQVDSICEGLQAMRPDSEQPFIIQAYARLGARDALAAEKIIREKALPIAPNSEEALSMLGLALHMAGKRRERDELMAQVLRDSDNAHVTDIAKKVMAA